MSDIDPALYGLAGIASVFLVLIGLIFAARRRAIDEKDLRPSWEGFCTGKIGEFLGIGIPAIRVSIYPEFLVVCFVFPKVYASDEIAQVDRFRKFFMYSTLRIRLKGDRIISVNLRNSRAEDAYISLLAIKNRNGMLAVK